jgi:hypothetical protein
VRRNAKRKPRPGRKFETEASWLSCSKQGRRCSQWSTNEGAIKCRVFKREAPAVRLPGLSRLRVCSCLLGGKPSRKPNQGIDPYPGCASNSPCVAVFQTRSPAHALHRASGESFSIPRGRALGRGGGVLCRADLTSKRKAIGSETLRGRRFNSKPMREGRSVSCYRQTSAINKNVASSARNGTKKATAVSCCSTKASKFFIGPILPLPSKPGPS